MTEIEILVLLILWVICGAVGYMIGEPKGQALGGLLMGLFLGILGVIIVALWPANDPQHRPTGPTPARLRTSATKKCPDCAEWVQAEAQVCRFCGYRPESWPAPVPPPVDPDGGWRVDPRNPSFEWWWDGEQRSGFKRPTP